MISILLQNFDKIKNSRGQASVEFLVIFAVALVIFLALFTYSSTYLTAQSQDSTQKTTQYYLNTLTKAANEVYFQGVGASKRIYFNVPEGIDVNRTGINTNIAYMRLYNSDLWSKSDVNLIGTLPTTKGGHYLYLRTYPNYVLISPSIVVVNKEVLYELMAKNASYTDPISITNYSDDSTNVTMELTWVNAPVSLNIDINSFGLSQTETKTVNVDINTNALASGLYFGNLRFVVDFNTFDDVNIDVPITIDVVSGYGSGTVGKIFVNPPAKTIDVYKGDTEIVTFTVCNITAGDLNNIGFTTDNYDINKFIYPVSKISKLEFNSCQYKDIAFTPSASYATGTYTGRITVESDDAQTATIDMNVNVLPYRWNRIAYDYFSSASYSSGAGWLDDWYKTGSVSVISTDNPYSASYHMQILKGGSVNRPITFLTRNKPKLEFYGKITGFIPGDEAYLKVSTNYFFWTTLKTWNVTNSNATYAFYEFDLSNYSNYPFFWIQFSRNSNNNQIASLEIDDVNVFETVPA